jgi:hypothetical protein
VTIGGGSGEVVSGGRGCSHLLLAGRFGLAGGGALTGRGTTWRRRIGGGGSVPGGAPRASRKRRTRSCSLCPGGRAARLLGAGGGCDSSFSAPSLVSHLKTSAIRARAKKISVSFIAKVRSRQAVSESTATSIR